MGATVAFGDLVYLATTDQRWELTDADAEATAGDVMLGIGITGGNDGDTGLILLEGFIREKRIIKILEDGEEKIIEEE